MEKCIMLFKKSSVSSVVKQRLELHGLENKGAVAFFFFFALKPRERMRERLRE